MVAGMKYLDIAPKLRGHGMHRQPAKGSHVKWTCPCGSHTVSVPSHREVSHGVGQASGRADAMPTRRMVDVKTYEVIAEQWEHGWELSVDGAGITQSSTLTDADQQTRDYLASELGGEPEDYRVTVRPQLGGLEDDVLGARAAIADAAKAQGEAADRSRRLGAGPPGARSVSHRRRRGPGCESRARFTVGQARHIVSSNTFLDLLGPRTT